ncbi:MAG: hypothetical protein FWE18_03160 [Alphaproteobacteria bacterium]|nr:hypothetical protein [Alphaproteobacteria bacterium]
MDEEKVVSYAGNKVSLFAPAQGGRRDIAYVRPGDEVALNFDINDAKALKVEIIKGDIHIVFANGSTLTLISMAAIGFGDDAPKLVTIDGRTLSLEEFLSVTSVLNYNEALLILANETQVEYSPNEPKLIQVASDQDADNTAGMPISGQGNSDVLTKGVPSDVIDSAGTVETQGVSTGRGSFVSTIWTSNYPYTLDKSNYMPGDTTPKNLPNLDVTVLYGSQLSNIGQQQVDGQNYLTFQFQNGFNYTDDKFSQLYANTVRQGGSSQDVFVNNSTPEMSYIFNMNYTRGTFPSYIEILVPKRLEGVIDLNPGAGLVFSNISSTDEGTVYAISDINPLGAMQFILSFAANTEIYNFDLSYSIKYLDPSTGQFLTATATNPISLYPVSQESHLDKSNGFVLSTVPNPVDAETGSGNDIIVGGGGNNRIVSGGGNDRIFTYGGDDYVDVGSGDNQVWGSQGSDLIKSDGTGHNELYYDNRVPPKIGANESDLAPFANTNTASAGIFTYYGFDSDALRGFAGSDFKNFSQINDYDILIKKSQGIDLIKGFQDIYLSQFNDTLIVSDSVDLGNLRIHGGELPKDSSGNYIRKDTDTVVIDDGFVGAEVRIGNTISTINSTNGVIVSFDGFEVVRGSKNDERFYGNVISGFADTDIAITLDGMGGNNVLDYSTLSSGYIVFDANIGRVDLKDGSGAGLGSNAIRNFSEIAASSGDDIFYGSFTNNYIYSDLGGGDIVSYEKSNAAVTIVLDGSSGSFFVYKTTKFFTEAELLANNVFHDELKGSFNIDNLALSARDDIIIVTDENGSYNFNAGGGRDTLSYLDLTNGVNVTFDNSGFGKVTKTGGSGVDTFSIMTQTASGQDTVNIYRIIGTAGDDYFTMDDAGWVDASNQGNKAGFSLDGGGGSNTLSYANVNKYIDVNGSPNGVTFNFNGINSSVMRAASSTVDFFKNFQTFIGSDFNDTFIFSSGTKMSDLQGLTIYGGGGTDIVNFTSLDTAVVNHIEVSFNGNEMNVGFFDTTRALVSTSIFYEIEGVVGTKGDDYFDATGTSGMSIYFNGVEGNDTADYSNISDDVVFHLSDRSFGNVLKGSVQDTLLNVQHILGGSGTNYYFLDSSFAYTIDGTAGQDTVSYSTSITWSVAKNTVTKGSGTNILVDNLINVEGVKGSQSDDRFEVDFDVSNYVTAPLADYYFYGNDINPDGPGTPNVNPKSDTDWVVLSSFTSNLSIILDSSAAGSYNTYDPTTSLIQTEGDVVISNLALSSGSTNLHLIHMEALLLGSGDDTVDIIGSYGAAVGRTRWTIDGGTGYNTVSYANDANLSNSNGNIMTVSLNASGAMVEKNYESGSDTRKATDNLTNVQEIVLSQFDDVVTISSGWETSKIKDIYGGGGNDTINFANINNDLKVTVENTGKFGVIIDGSFGVLPTFYDFNNIRLSSGESKVIFEDGSNFSGLAITASTSVTALGILDFQALSASLTVTLGELATDMDTIVGGSNNFSVYLISYKSYDGFTMIFANNNNTVIGSLNKNINFTGTGSGNTLDYRNTNGDGVVIQLGDFYLNNQTVPTNNGGRVTKNNSDNIFDTFDDSFSIIYGTTRDDTVLIANLNQSTGSSKTIELGGQAGDRVLVDLKDLVSGNVISVGANLDIISGDVTSSSLSGSATIKGYGGVNRVDFGASDNTITFSSAFSSAGNLDYANYNATDGFKNTLDFSAVNQVIFDAAKQQVSKNSLNTDYGNLTYVQGRDNTGAMADVIFKNFYSILAASADTLFYGQGRNNYSITGAAGSNIIMDYSQSAATINIMLLDRQINKAGAFFDTFTNVSVINGTDYGDTVTINKTNISPDLNNITIDGGAGNDRVVFAFTDSTAIVANFSDSGTSFSFGSSQSININFMNFEIFQFTPNDDQVTIESDATGGYSLIGGGGNDTVIYTGGASGNVDIEFDAATGRVSRNGVNQLDAITSFSTIEYTGNGTATFKGSEGRDMTYKGGAGNSNSGNAVLDYSNGAPSSAITVTFTQSNGLIKVEKGSSGLRFDYFNGYINTIIGTQGNDMFILDARASSLPELTIKGGGGDADTVSYEKYQNSGITDFDIDAQGLVVITNDTSGQFSNYKIDSQSIQSFKLTNGNDRFHGDANSSITIDGGTGVDILDYSSLSVDLTIDFTTNRVIKETATGTNVDTFYNFNGFEAGSGNNTIIINDKIIDKATNATGDINVGVGASNTNTLNAAFSPNDTVGYNMEVVYGQNGTYNSVLTYSGSDSQGNSLTGPVSANYNGFQNMFLGSGTNKVSFYYDAVYGTTANRLQFTSASSDATFLLMGGGSGSFQELFLDNVTDTAIFSFAATSTGVNFMTIAGFSTIGVLPGTTANYQLSIKTSGLNGSHVFYGGNTSSGIDEILYDQAIDGLQAGLVRNGNDIYIEIKGSGSNSFTDKLYDIEKIVLSNEDDTFDIGDGDFNGYTSNLGALTIDMGGGLNNVLSFASMTSALTIDIANDGKLGGIPSVNGILNWNIVALTNQADTVTFSREVSTKIDGGGGRDTANYTNSDFTSGVILSVGLDNNGAEVMNVNKIYNNVNYSDQLKNFEIYNLTNYDDTFTYMGATQLSADTTANTQIVIDMGGSGANGDLVDFSNMSSSIEKTKFVYTSTGELTVVNDGTLGGVVLNYKFLQMDTVILGGKDSSLVLESLPPFGGAGGVTFIADINNTTFLDLSQITNANNMVVDVGVSSVLDNNGSNPTYGLTYKNFRGVIGGAKVVSYSMSETDESNNNIDYTVYTGNSNATIDYSRNDGGITGGITVNVDINSNTTVDKANNTTDTIAYDDGSGSGNNAAFGTFVGSNYDDTFVFSAAGFQNGLSIDSGANWQSDPANGNDTLNLSAINSSIKYTIDLSQTEDSAVAGSATAKFKDFRNILGSSTQANEFTLALAGMSRSYVASLDGGGMTGSSFSTTGSGLAAGTSGKVTIASGSASTSVSLSSNIGANTVSVDMVGFDTLNFNADMDIVIAFADDYMNSTVTTINANSSRNNTLNLSAIASNVNINSSGFALTGPGGAPTVVNLSGFNNLVLGGQQDNLTISSFIPGLNIDGGGAGVVNPDTLNIENMSNYSVVLTSKTSGAFSIDVYNSLTPVIGTDAHSSFLNFSLINIDVSANILILDGAPLATLQAIHVNNSDGTSALSLKASDGSGIAISAAKLDLTANTITINAKEIAYTGINNFSFGSGSDRVILDSSTSGYKVDGGQGSSVGSDNNEIVFNAGSYNVNIGGAAGDTATFNGNTFINFYNLNFTAGSSNTNNITMNNIATNLNYRFSNIDTLTFGSDFAAKQVNTIALDGNRANFSNGNINDSVGITASYNNSMNLGFDAVSIDYTLTVTLGNLFATGSGGINAPTLTGNGSAVLILSNISENGTQQGSYNFDVINNGIRINGQSNTVDVFGFSDFEVGPYNSTVTYSSSSTIPGGRTFMGGTPNSKVDAGGFFAISNGGAGNQVSDSSGHIDTFQGFGIFTGSTRVNLITSEESYQSLKAMDSDSNFRSANTDSSTRYNMTDGNDTLMVSEVKHNTIVDMLKGDDAIVLNGHAAFYNVEHFKDAYIIIDGKQYQTGGSYLIITDDNGNQMYVFNANLDDIKSGGVFNYDDEGNISSSGYKQHQDSYDSSKPVENADNHPKPDHSHSNDGYSNGSNGVSSYSSGLGVGDDLVLADNNHGHDSFNNLPFELVEDTSLGLHYDDEFNVDNIHHDSLETNVNNALDDLSIQVAGGEGASQNQEISDNDLSDILNQTFTNENDDLDNLNLNLDSSNNSIDVSAINENLVEETTLQESDIDSYKMESERNEDGTLKINHHNNSNGNSGMGSL